MPNNRAKGWCQMVWDSKCRKLGPLGGSFGSTEQLLSRNRVFRPKPPPFNFLKMFRNLGIMLFFLSCSHSDTI